MLMVAAQRKRTAFAVLLFCRVRAASHRLMRQAFVPLCSRILTHRHTPDL